MSVFTSCKSNQRKLVSETVLHELVIYLSYIVKVFDK